MVHCAPRFGGRELPPLHFAETPEVVVEVNQYLETVVPEPRPVDLSDPDLSIPAGIGAVLITDAEAGGERVLGFWLEKPDWPRRVDGDVVVTLADCAAHDKLLEGLHVNVYLVHDGKIMPLGTWHEVPIFDLAATLRACVSTATALHSELEEAGIECATHPAAE